MSKEQMILDTDHEAATLRTITGWVSRRGIYYGDDERTARWDGCTHIVCECGKPTPKTYAHCDECREKRQRERWLALPLVEWDGETPICQYGGDEYFFSSDELYDWCDNNAVHPGDLMLVTCEPQYLSQIDTDYWSDDLPEDGDLPAEVEAALNALNKAIREHGKAYAWSPGKRRVEVREME